MGLKMNEKEVEKRIGRDKMPLFLNWMRGQTVGLKDGEADYYDDDVNRFIRYKCNPDNEPLAEFD